MLNYFNTYQPTTVTNHPTYFINWYRVNSVKPCYIIRQLFLGPQSLRGTSSCSSRSLHFHSFVNLRNLSCFPMTERRMNVKSPKKGSRLGSDFWKYIYVLSAFVKILAKIQHPACSAKNKLASLYLPVPSGKQLANFWGALWCVPGRPPPNITLKKGNHLLNFNWHFFFHSLEKI